VQQQVTREQLRVIRDNARSVREDLSVLSAHIELAEQSRAIMLEVGNSCSSIAAAKARMGLGEGKRNTLTSGADVAMVRTLTMSEDTTVDNVECEELSGSFSGMPNFSPKSSPKNSQSNSKTERQKRLTKSNSIDSIESRLSTGDIPSVAGVPQSPVLGASPKLMQAAEGDRTQVEGEDWREEMAIPSAPPAPFSLSRDAVQEMLQAARQKYLLVTHLGFIYKKMTALGFELWTFSTQVLRESGLATDGLLSSTVTGTDEMDQLPSGTSEHFAQSLEQLILWLNVCLSNVRPALLAASRCLLEHLHQRKAAAGELLVACDEYRDFYREFHSRMYQCVQQAGQDSLDKALRREKTHKIRLNRAETGLLELELQERVPLGVEQARMELASLHASHKLLVDERKYLTQTFASGQINTNDSELNSAFLIPESELVVGVMVGAGEYGEVFKCLHRGSLVAVKVVKAHDTTFAQVMLQGCPSSA
jgi:hypothetical protein